MTDHPEIQGPELLCRYKAFLDMESRRVAHVLFPERSDAYSYTPIDHFVMSMLFPVKRKWSSPLERAAAVLRAAGVSLEDDPRHRHIPPQKPGEAAE